MGLTLSLMFKIYGQNERNDRNIIFFSYINFQGLLIYICCYSFIFYYKLLSDTMSGQFSSQTAIKAPQIEPNEQMSEYDCQTLSSKSNQQNSERESSIGKSKTLVRKPDNQSSNLESFKIIRRKSQEKHNKNSMDAPPRYPKSGNQLKMSENSSLKSSSEQSSLAKSNSLAQQQQKSQSGEDMIKFKKKPLTKQEIIEIKDYMQGLDKQESEVNSVAGTEKPIQNRDIQPPLIKQLNKKSKTQYFHIEDFQKNNHIDPSQSQNLTESDRNFIISLKQKCKSVDENNSLLQKRISWLREEVQMHLERQSKYEKEKSQIEKSVHEKDMALKEREAIHKEEKDMLKRQVETRDKEIERLKALFINLHNKFQDDRQSLCQQIQFLRNEKEAEFEQRLKAQDKIKELELHIEKMLQQKKQFELDTLSMTEHYSKSFIEKILNENKYLKVENHTLNKCKDDVIKLQRQVKRVTNQRDGLKKKIIECAKRQLRKYRNNEDQDSSDSSQFFVLSQISTPSASFKKN